MAGPRTRQSPRRNPSPAGEDELAGGAPTDGSVTSAPTPAISRAPIPAPAPAPAPPGGTYTDVDLQKATKLALNSVVQSQAHAPATKPQEKSLKARFPDLYWDNSHQDCYRFCKQ